ncbi:MAG TPA: c-type cytochrome [Candidatus Polarisedimenticolaceae bacterium]|nr:c-type cytochrome [Candidatus Polarisedimenticolaceae bacterium]
MRRPLALAATALLATGALAAAPDLGTEAQRKSGQTLYGRYCSQCHGDQGDGNGYAAPHLKPKPRNFTSGKFKIRTTPSGALPTTDDLKRVIKLGMPYSSMPAWPNLTDDQIRDLAYYVKTFSADFANAELNVAPVELPKPPSYTKESAAAGRKVYEETGCIKCHGDLGRGDGPSARTLADDFGNPLKPADFSQRWTFRGGPAREDIFRTMTTGLNGTPMPAFGDALTAEQRWAITDYMYSLGDGDAPGYATLIHAHHVDDPIDVAKGAAAFEGIAPARIPIVGQIMEPGREFHPPVVSVLVSAIYDGTDIAFLVRWNDMSAETTGANAPNLPVPIEEEDAQEMIAAAEGATDEWGEAAPSEPAADAAPAAQFSDAVAIQVPLALPTGARKPYFLFGDATNGVDLWFVDLARGEADQYTAKGSAAVAAADASDVTSVAKYDRGEWSVIFKRRLTGVGGVPFNPGSFVPIAFSVWDGGSRERGNKRGLTQWSSLYVEPQVIVSARGPAIKAGLLVLGVELLIIFGVRRSRGARKEPVHVPEHLRTGR